MNLKFALFTAAVLFTPLASATNVVIGPPGRVAPDSVMRDAITITNNGSESVTFQARAMIWSQVGGKNVETPTREILISPGRVEIPAGEKRVVRIARQRPSSGKTLTYRAHFNELPKPFLPGVSIAQMLTEYSLPFVFEPASASPAVLSASWQGNRLEVTNTGGRAAKLSRLGPSGKEAWVKGLVGWVLPGATISFEMPRAAPSLTLTVNGVEQTLSVK